MSDLFWIVIGVVLVVGLVWYFVLPLIAKTRKSVIMSLRDIQIKNIKKNIKAFNISKEELFDE